jgi:hypothetical protein
MPMRRDMAADDERLPLVGRVRRRLAVGHALQSGAAGLAIGALVGTAARMAGWTPLATAFPITVVALVVAVAGYAWHRASRTETAAALRVEQARPECRNVVFTAVELRAYRDRARPAVRDRVLADAEEVLSGLAPGAVVSLRLQTTAFALSLVVAVAVIFSVQERAPRRVISTVQRVSSRAPADGRLTAVVTLLPPAHTGQPSIALTEPDRISAIEGTRLRLTVTGAQPLRIRFGSTVLSSKTTDASTSAELTLRESGYLAIEGTPASRLIPVSVTPDRRPTVTIEHPGKDLLLPNVAATVAIETSAKDDFGLESLTLRYTKVSGSGEQFDFVEGELPLAIARQDRRAWSGRGELPLSRLELEPGDAIVYRVVARDARPGETGLASSDTYFVEVAGPGQVTLEAFEMPPDRERYGLSQQMIVLKIQRLRERETKLERPALQEEAASVAAEQRAVRGNFVFLMGGHIEDEEEEAEQSHEIQEGRLQNTARREISRAINHMSLVEQALAVPDTARALQQARLAVDALQRAFGRNRYILRTLPVRSRIDQSRRLTGKLDEASSWTRKLAESRIDREAAVIRDLLAGAVAVAEKLTTSSSPSLAAEVGRLAEEALAIDSTKSEWQQISSRLSALRDTIASGTSRETQEQRLADALTPLVEQARQISVPTGLLPAPADPLRGAWAEELKRR